MEYKGEKEFELKIKGIQTVKSGDTKIVPSLSLQ